MEEALGAVAEEVPEAVALPEVGKRNSNIMINKYIIERSNFQRVWIHWLESVLSLFSFLKHKEIRICSVSNEMVNKSISEIQSGSSQSNAAE
ncbi:hypothetical protein LEP1GSC043_0268 [Leptospira weilii str. Ecochallenge]|uniref:Uncharacterized protein n=1 Tax=Leptospira weilii str. Ecochallenge TaxID=1049986 RepID=N1U8R8_9LEPT|nr:hypothetical protein LEP1GSC043_0268 [Leptospira weilii str. Ecochallenge]